ncbi:MAG TPA: SLBB domain-containing protein [Armatimonadota bacterium]|nr:SLBB domain-containing protein [Armatimonadota bacterium]
MFFFSRGEQVALAVLLVALVAAGGAMWWVGSHANAPAEPFFTDAPAARAGEMITVHVVGEVNRPGLFKIAAGARADDIIKLAGGATPRADLTAVNLAAEVVDGQQLYVPAAAESAAGADATNSRAPQPAAGPSKGDARPRRPRAGAAPAAVGKVNLNHAGAEELDQLPGIGPKRFADMKDRVTL